MRFSLFAIMFFVCNFCFGSIFLGCSDDEETKNDAGEKDEPATLQAEQGIVGLEIRPESESGLANHQMLLDIESFSGEVVLPETINYHGKTELADTAAIEASIEIFSSEEAGVIPFCPLPSITTKTNRLTGEIRETLFFLNVQRGRYSMRAKALEAHLAPPLFIDDALEIEASQTTIFTFRRAFTRFGRLTDSRSTPLQALQVKAVHESGMWESSTATTNEAGEFQLYFPAKPGIYDIRLPATNGADAVYPAYRKAAQFLIDEEVVTLEILENETENGEYAFRLPFEAPKACELSGLVHLTEDETSGVRAAIYITGASHHGEVLQKCETNEMGEFSIRLPRGDGALQSLRLAVIPKTDERAAAAIFDDIQCDAENVSMVLPLEKRTPVTVRLIAKETGEPVAKALVQVTGSPMGMSDALKNVWQKPTDEAGEASFLLDKTSYEILVRPMVASGFFQIRREYAITQESQVIELSLSKGRYVSGLLLSQEGVRVPFAHIDVYPIISGTGHDMPIKPIATSATDEAGEFIFIIP